MRFTVALDEAAAGRWVRDTAGVFRSLERGAGDGRWRAVYMDRMVRHVRSMVQRVAILVRVRVNDYLEERSPEDQGTGDAVRGSGVGDGSPVGKSTRGRTALDGRAIGRVAMTEILNGFLASCAIRCECVLRHRLTAGRVGHFGCLLFS